MGSDSDAAGYMLPSDEKEGDRLDTQHALFKATFDGKLFFSPVTEPQAILDVGCGTSNWAIDTAKLFPAAEVIGIDLGQPQPSESPTNYQYHILDWESDWLLGNNHFDLIHSRCVFIAMKDHQKYIVQSLEHLKPGGWLEIQDLDFPWPCPGSLQRWSEYMIEGSAKVGTNLAASTAFDAWMAAAGFVNIQHEVLLWPFGEWPTDPNLKRVGTLARMSIYNGLAGISTKTFTQVLGWSGEEVDQFLQRVRTDLMRDDHCWFMRIHVIYGQKPVGV